MSTNEVTLDGFDIVDEENYPFTSTGGPLDNQSHAASSFRTEKRGRKLAKDDVNMHIAKSINRMVDVFDNLGKGTTDIINLKKKVPPKEIWA